LQFIAAAVQRTDRVERYLVSRPQYRFT
jgi:hypothetical protein